MFETNFPRQRSNRPFKYVFIVIAIIIVLVIISNVAAVGKMASDGKHIYHIEAYDNNRTEVFFSDSIISRNENCITFVGTFGREQSVCAENLVITKY